MESMFIELIQLVKTLTRLNAKFSSCIFTMIRNDAHPDADPVSTLYSLKIATLAIMEDFVSEMGDSDPFKELLLSEIALCYEYFKNDSVVGHLDIRTMVDTFRAECEEKDKRVAAGDDILNGIFGSDKGN